ncbi:N-terminal kinase-like protein isoform X4 [Hetaerina americana]|uniref:N-terminal kinase-like protein isoform X4 n=1 Tax=Hetaerina americana TaxID=62018 RepID=UPI003A7F608D
MWSFFARDPSKDFPYEIGDPVPGLEGFSVWGLHKGKRKGTGEDVSVFVFDIRNGNETQFDVAKSAVKRLKSLRHPSILTYLDSLESDKVLYLATEYVEPLETHLTQLSKDGNQRDLYLSWGIFQITRALSFLNNDGNLRHNNVCLSSVFVNAGGEWRLGGLEYVAGALEGTGLPIKILPSLEKYDPPEKADSSKQRFITKCSTDMWGLGCLIWEAFNGPLPQPVSLKTLEKIPKQLCPVYCELVGSSPASRPNPADVITRCRKAGGYFKNDLVDALLFLEEIQIRERSEKNRFFGGLAVQVDSFPENVCRHKILPQLITAFEYGDAGSAVLTPMFKLGRLLDEAEYQKRIVPCVVKLFCSNDRATRIRLLQQLENFINHLQASTVNDQIFPQIALGFMDTNATIREQTVKSVIQLAPKLNYNNLNVEVLRHFARLQSKDEQGGIRTNTTVCLGKIAQHLHPQIRQKVLISAFIRAMRDPFPPARSAGVLALAATQQYFLLSEVATRILPALCQLTVDPEKSVRDNVFRTVRGFLGKLEKVSEDPSLRESMEQPSSSSISTTTSSVTSMTSLEQEEVSKGNESVSDYDETCWEAENWGDMENNTFLQTPAVGPLMSSDSKRPATESGAGAAAEGGDADGWDNEDWGSLEVGVTAPTAEEGASGQGESSAMALGSAKVSGGWDDAEWEPIEEASGATNRMEEAKKKREERKLQRQKELEARRATRLAGTGSAMKLGSKKV